MKRERQKASPIQNVVRSKRAVSSLTEMEILVTYAPEKRCEETQIKMPF
jgi:hypothetical protein